MPHLKNIFPVIGIVFLGLLACNKKDGENQHLNPDDQTAFDLMSVKEGSTWRYGGRDGVTYTRYARGKDTIKLDARYSYYERKDDNAGSFDPEYFGKNKDAYLTLVDVDGNQDNYLNYLFWKDGATVGTSWDNTGKVNAPTIGRVNVLVESYVAEDNLIMTLSSQTFTRVVHVHSDLKGGPFNTRLGNLDIWLVKGIGILREEVHIDVLGQYQLDHTDSLLDYHIVP